MQSTLHRQTTFACSTRSLFEIAYVNEVNLLRFALNQLRFELFSSILQFSKSGNSWLKPIPFGADRDRTDDLRLAKPALSQLSYSPGAIF